MQIILKSVITIKIWLYLTRFRKDFPVYNFSCTRTENDLIKDFRAKLFVVRTPRFLNEKVFFSAKVFLVKNPKPDWNFCHFLFLSFVKTRSHLVAETRQFNIAVIYVGFRGCSL